jgi:quercetin 2,3-dioxygenase
MDAKIYKSDWREKAENQKYKCWSTFKSSDNFFGILQGFNEVHLNANSSISQTIPADVVMMLIPVLGCIDFEFGTQKGFVHINQLQVFKLHQGQFLEIINPYEKESVRYLQLLLEVDSETIMLQNDFNLSQKNTLHTVFKNKKIETLLGVYDGRSEETFGLSSPENGLFTFVIQGAFEFQNRLLESGDALHLTGNNTIEFEALSENAMLLMLEITTIQ